MIRGDIVDLECVETRLRPGWGEEGCVLAEYECVATNLRAGVRLGSARDIWVRSLAKRNYT